MKYRLEGTTIEAIDTYVRVTVGGKTEVTASQCPAPAEVAGLLRRMQGYPPNRRSYLHVAGQLTMRKTTRLI